MARSSSSGIGAFSSSPLIRVDSRVGSKHLASPLRKHGRKVKLCKLRSADCWFWGNLATGRQRVGIELKKFDDLIQSFLSRRFQTKQLPRMLKRYAVVVLIVQGDYREAADGMVEKGVWWNGGYSWLRARSPLTYLEVEGFLWSFVMCGRVIVVKTRTDKETVRFINMVYGWCQKPWESHRAHKSIVEELRKHGAQPAFYDPWLGQQKGFPQAVAARLPNVNLTKAPKIARAFGSVLAMARARIADWRKIQWVSRGGRKQSIGPKTAQAAWRAFRQLDRDHARDLRFRARRKK